MTGKNGELTLLNEDRESKIDGFKRCLLILTDEQEILRLQIPMHHSHKVTHVNHIHNLPENLGRFQLGVAPLGNNPIKKLAAGAQLHDQMQILAVLISTLEFDYIGLARQVLQNQNLPPHILNVLIRHQLSSRYGLARVFSARRFLCAQTSHAELASAQLLFEGINGIYIDARLAQNWSNLRRRGALAKRPSSS